MMESEKKIFEMLDERHPMAKYWLPLTWATNVINRARQERLISCDHLVQTILMEMSDIRLRLGSLIGYDNVNVPLVYTQVSRTLCMISPVLSCPVLYYWQIFLFCPLVVLQFTVFAVDRNTSGRNLSFQTLVNIFG